MFAASKGQAGTNSPSQSAVQDPAVRNVDSTPAPEASGFLIIWTQLTQALKGLDRSAGCQTIAIHRSCLKPSPLHPCLHASTVTVLAVRFLTYTCRPFSKAFFDHQSLERE